MEATHPTNSSDGLRRTVVVVAALNLGFFGIEFAVALAIGSVALLADSIDFLEDASINLLILVGLGWSLAARARLGMVLAGILLVPSLATVWVAARKLLAAEVTVPDPTLLAVTGLGALAVNLTCALLLARHRRAGGSLARAAFLSARNDAIANVAIIGAGLATAWLLSPWPDLIVGIGIAVLNAGAAWEVWEAARGEAREAQG
jgi:Co/Zn/Cd efflux system component